MLFVPPCMAAGMSRSCAYVTRHAHNVSYNANRCSIGSSLQGETDGMRTHSTLESGLGTFSQAETETRDLEIPRPTLQFGVMPCARAHSPEPLGALGQRTSKQLLVVTVPLEKHIEQTMVTLA